MNNNYKLDEQHRLKKPANIKYASIFCKIMSVIFVLLFVVEIIVVSIRGVQYLFSDNVKAIVVNIAYLLITVFFIVMYCLINKQIYLYKELNLIVRVNAFGKRNEYCVNFNQVHAVLEVNGATGFFSATFYNDGVKIVSTNPIQSPDMFGQLKRLGIHNIKFKGLMSDMLNDSFAEFYENDDCEYPDDIFDVAEEEDNKK